MVHVGDGDGVAQPPATLTIVGLDDPRARALENMHIEEMRSRYGGRGPGPLAAAEFDPPDGCFVVATIAGEAVACGGFHRLRPEIAEIKRMFVEPGARGRGLGGRILRFLEQRAQTVGCTEAWLETGSEQPDAIALYSSAGYRPVAPYGEFKNDERSRCFSRMLGEDSSPSGLAR